MKKTLRKPENWQDFESLCKKLWGEIWKVPNEIRKNGRSGQSQCGVDIYAIPSEKKNYWGIQCKGKDEYTKSKLTKIEIDSEIRKAKTFKPELETFIFATTSNKDAKIEEYVRIKDLESRKNGSFKILLFSWEDIVELIEENPATFNYYVNAQNYRDHYQINVTLNDSDGELELNPVIIQEKEYFLTKEERERIDILSGRKWMNQLIRDFKPDKKIIKEVKEQLKLRVVIQNIGNKVIEDWKFRLKVEGDFIDFSDELKEEEEDQFLAIVKPIRPKISFTNVDENELIYKPLLKPLVIPH